MWDTLNYAVLLYCLFFVFATGSGERSFAPAGDGSEVVTAADLSYTCGGVYQTFNLINHTTPLIKVLNKSSSTSWGLHASIDIYHLYEV